MNIIKTIIPKQHQSLTVIFLVMLMSFFILSIRVTITKTISYFFLIWNIFLAIIPYIITMYLSERKQLERFSFFIAFSLWLAFLPNAPYIITDLYHLKTSSYNLIWLDTLLIASFAIAGVLLFYYSLNQMKTLLLRFFSRKTSETIIITTLFLSSFGVYIGRFLRYNSWEILSNPMKLFNDILAMILHPITFYEVWLFTFTFGIFLTIGYLIFKNLKITVNKKEALN